jgi:hypothetical protein
MSIEGCPHGPKTDVPCQECANDKRRNDQIDECYSGVLKQIVDASKRCVNPDCPNEKWIDVKERLPEINQQVLYYSPMLGTFYGSYQGDNVWAGRCGFLGGDEVTHWLPSRFFVPKDNEKASKPKECEKCNEKGWYYENLERPGRMPGYNSNWDQGSPPAIKICECRNRGK